MKIGFIGTGKIASSVITGICSSTIFYNKILISPRNKIIAKNLKRKFKNSLVITSVIFRLEKFPEFVLNYGQVEERVKEKGEVNLQNIKKIQKITN